MRPVEIPTALAGGSVNALWLPGDPPTLVDTGPRSAGALDALGAGLRDAGYRLADVARVVITHAHVDHFGLARAISAESGARVAILGPGARALTDFPDVWAERLDLLERVARASGVPAALTAPALSALTARSGWAEPLDSGRIDRLRDGDVLRAGGRDWRVLHTPGHAPDHLCLHHAPSGALLCGDLLLRGAPTPLLPQPSGPDGRRPATLAALVGSWRRVGRLPVDIAWPGHGGPIRAHRVLIARRLAGVRRRLHEARGAVAGGATSVWEIARALGYEGSPRRLQLALGEAIALLDWLTARGSIRRTVRDGRLTYGPPPR